MSLARRLLRVLRAELQAEPHGGAPPAPRSVDSVPREPPATLRHDPTLAACYANLELPYGADLAAVRDAWKRLVRRYHPDLHAADASKQQIATELVAGLNHAYEELTRHLGGKP